MEEYIYTTTVTPDLEIKHYRHIIVNTHLEPPHCIPGEIIPTMSYEYKENEKDMYSDWISTYRLGVRDTNNQGIWFVRYICPEHQLDALKKYHTNKILYEIKNKLFDELQLVHCENLRLSDKINTLDALMEENNETK